MCIFTYKLNISNCVVYHCFIATYFPRGALTASPPLSFADQHSQKDSQTEQSPWSSYSSQLWHGAISCRRLKPQLKRSYWTGVRVSLTKTSDLFEWIWNKTFNPCPEKTPIFWRCFSVNVFCCYDLIFLWENKLG